MTRLAIFVFSVLTTVAAVAGLDAWIDPFGDRYREGPVAAALAHRPECFVSEAVLTPRTWPEFKLDLYERRAARVVVVGSSRVQKIGASPGERAFANLGVPGTGAETVGPLFRRLNTIRPQRLRVYLGVEEFWFTPQGAENISFARSRIRELKYLVSGETLRGTLDVLRRAPGSIRHPDALRTWHVVSAPAGCIVDSGASVLGGAAAAWGPDGTGWYRYELLRQPNPIGTPYLSANGPLYEADGVSRDRVAALDDALRFARARGWEVVGFAAPFAAGTLERLQRSPASRGLEREFGPAMTALFARHGFEFLDLRDNRLTKCGPARFANHDGAHTDAVCGRRIRRLLDRELDA